MLLVLAAASALAACQPGTPAQAPPAADTPQVTADTSAEPARSTDVPSADEASPMPASSGTPAFADKVWKVKQSSAVAPGTTYTFLTGGTLVIASPGSTPLRGGWTFDDGALTMIEEGQTYPTDVVRLDEGEFHIRSHNPGEPVEIILVPAPDQPLPRP
ncbi:MAG TPA: hypothetical protein VGD42_22920 [Lysobacter sp.]